MACHLPFLVPVAGLVLFAVLPFWTALAIYLPLTAVSLAMVVPIVRAMYGPPVTGALAMRGAEAVVVTAEGRSGLARCEGELWKYSAPGPLAPGDHVEIVDVAGLTAIVRPAPRPQWRRPKDRRIAEP